MTKPDIEKKLNCYKGYEVPVFASNNDGEDFETTANFKFNFISNSFVELDVETNDNKLCYDTDSMKRQIKDLIFDFHAEKKQKWEDRDLKNLYKQSLQDFMYQQDNLRVLNDFDFDFIHYQLIYNQNKDDLGEYNYSSKLGGVVTIDAEKCNKIIKEEVDALNKHRELSEKYSDKQFIFIKGNESNPINSTFIKGDDMSYRNNDIYVYDQKAEMDKFIERINKDLEKNKNNTAGLTAELLSAEDMISQNFDVLNAYDTNSKLKENYANKTFLFVSNGNDDSNEVVKGQDMEYNNNTLYVYETDSNLSYIANSINSELGFHQSAMTAKILNFQEMKIENLEAIVKHSEKSNDISQENKMNTTKIKKQKMS